MQSCQPKLAAIFCFRIIKSCLNSVNFYNSNGIENNQKVKVLNSLPYFQKWFAPYSAVAVHYL